MHLSGNAILGRPSASVRNARNAQSLTHAPHFKHFTALISNSSFMRHSISKNLRPSQTATPLPPPNPYQNLRGDRPHETSYFIGRHRLASFHAALSAAFASRHPCVA